eukprot:Nk52_evm14s343 gene=Nk52_evmTU14s343
MDKFKITNVKSILSQEPDVRTEEDIKRMVNFLRNENSFFEKISAGIAFDICKNMKLLAFDPNEMVCRQGDMGENFYIILSGSVDIIVKMDDMKSIPQPSKEFLDKKNAAEIARTMGGGLGGLMGKLKKNLVVKEIIENKHAYGNVVGNLGQGSSFGELALLQPDSKRNATIIADTHTETAVIERSIYNKSLKRAHQKDLDEKMDFVGKLPFFRNWSRWSRVQMAMCLNKTEMNFDCPIVRQGSPANKVYFIGSGLAKVVVDLSKAPKNRQNLRYSSLSKADGSSGQSGSGGSSSTSTGFTRGPSVTTRLELNASGGKLKRPWEHPLFKKKTVELCVLGAFEILGDLEVVCDLPNYLSSVYCLECGEIYEVNRDDFLRLLQKKNPETYDKIKAFTGYRVELRSGRLKHLLLNHGLGDLGSHAIDKEELALKLRHSPDVVLSDEIVQELNKSSKGFDAPRFHVSREDYYGKKDVLIDIKSIYEEQKKDRPKTAMESAMFTVRRAHTAPAHRASTAPQYEANISHRHGTQKKEEHVETLIRRTPINAWRVPSDAQGSPEFDRKMASSVSHNSFSRAESRAQSRVVLESDQTQLPSRAQTTTPYVRHRRYSCYADDIQFVGGERNDKPVEDLDPAKQASFKLKQDYEMRKKKLQQVTLLRKKSPAYCPITFYN